MARQAKINYWASRGGYGCWIRGHQKILAKGPETPETYAAAAAEFASLSSLAQADERGDENTMRVVLENYLRHLADQEVAGTTLAMRTEQFALFCDHYGEIPAGKLKHLQVIELCRRLRTHGTGSKHSKPWGQGTLRLFLGGLGAACRWAKKAGILQRNPLEGIDLPAERSRGAEAVLSPQELEHLRGGARPYSRRLITVLAQTGARPGEIIAATADHFNVQAGTLTYHARCRQKLGSFTHKTARKGKDRIIFLSGEALEITRALAVQYPTGPLFRNRLGKPWNKVALKEHFRQLRKRLGLPHLTAYSLRHTFATRWLEAGQPVETLACLLGNTPEVIHKHYAHLIANPLGLRGRLEEFMRSSDLFGAAGTQSQRRIAIAS